MAATKAARGTKRTCQNTACGARFYDLQHDPITCPACSTVFVVPPAASLGTGNAGEGGRRRKPEYVTVAPDAPEVEAEDGLADVEAAEETITAGDEETFLEPEEDEGADVSIIVGTPEGEEEV